MRIQVAESWFFPGEFGVRFQVLRSFEIDAATLGEAVQKYGEASKEGVDRAMRELQELRRQASSSILVPGSTPGLGAGLPPPPGGGKLKLP